MDTIIAFVEHLGAWGWFALAVVLFVLETIVPGIHFLWFGMSAAIVGLIMLVAPIAWQWQLIAFAVIAMATVFWVRRTNSPTAQPSDEPTLNVRGAEFIGRTVVVEDAIVNGRGRVRAGDTLWGAQGEDAPRGARVEVTGVNGTTLVVAAPDAE
ncbi:MAG: NfeD family protein [Hyphomicrobium sp.]